MKFTFVFLILFLSYSIPGSVQNGFACGKPLEVQVDAMRPEASYSIFQSAKQGKLNDLIGLKNLVENIDARDTYQNTPLIWAAYKGHVDVVEFLLKTGANPILKNQWGNTALMLASAKGHADVVRLLIQAGSPVNDVNALGNTSLIFSSQFGSRWIIEKSNLIKNELYVLHSPSAQSQPSNDLHYVVGHLSAYLSIMTQLLDAGAEVNFVNQSGLSALLMAAQTGVQEGVDLLMKSGANIHQVDKYKNSALTYAAQCNHFDVIKSLFGHESKPNYEEVLLAKTAASTRGKFGCVQLIGNLESSILIQDVKFVGFPSDLATLIEEYRR